MDEIGHLIARWIHYIAGVAWIGHLYFFNWVNANLQKELSPEIKKEVNPRLMLRALSIFRWGAMFTFLSGFYMLSAIPYYFKAGFPFGGDGGPWMTAATVYGTIMWFNVWFIIWPRQKRIIGAALGGAAPKPQDAPQAALASKINTYLSVPLLLGMIMGPHGAQFSETIFGKGWQGVIIGTAVGFVITWGLYKHSAKIKGDKI